MRNGRPPGWALTERAEFAAQAADTKDKAKTSRDGAAKAVRLAWSHILFPIKTDATAAGSAFDLDHLSLSAKDRLYADVNRRPAGGLTSLKMVPRGGIEGAKHLGPARSQAVVLLGTRTWSKVRIWQRRT
jgi:hypothetical protein